MKKSGLKLIIGDKNLSSWSMRPWLALKESGLEFEEILVALDQSDTKSKIAAFSPSQKVPCLIHENSNTNQSVTVYDSLAICEYLAELAPNSGLWPTDFNKRAQARSCVAEMHSGFQSLRSQLSMDIRLKIELRHLTEQTVSDIKRILIIWQEALSRSPGPFLFGKFGIADAFYAPVVFRFISYGIDIRNQPALNYIKSMKDHPHVQSWVKDALAEKPEPFIFY